VGGGTIRDVLLGSFPPFCFADENYLYLAIAVSLFVFFFHPRLEFIHRPLLYFDALGLGTFLVIGTGKALRYDAGFIVAVMGMSCPTRYPLFYRRRSTPPRVSSGGSFITSCTVLASTNLSSP
jgi:uncharacterized membrane protein YeiH